MLVYDRRRCRELHIGEMRERLSLLQRAVLGELAHKGWHLLFVRGQGAAVYVQRGDELAVIGRTGRLVKVRQIAMRPMALTGPDCAADEAAPLRAVA